MTRLLIAIAAAAGCAAAPAQAQGNGTQARVLDALAGSTLTIRGSTTVGARWHCRSDGMQSRVAIADDLSPTAAIPEVRGVTVYVAVSALRCQSGPMERAMRHALRADRDTAAQHIIGRFEVPDTIPVVHPNEAHLVGGLRVAAVERGVFLHASVMPEPDGTLRVRSQIPLTLSQFRIEAPRVLFGAIRARDAISVEVDLRFPAPPSDN
ncbi:MAG TPA: hypothetical protein VFO66_03175 [Gemmatimonadaceae bacterium]|nr:hypothetical protein [Gemmatimonadaceae bacterium]